MRLTYFYLISALGLSIGLLEVRHEKEHRKQERLVSEMMSLTDRSIQQIGPLLDVLKVHTNNFKKLSRHKEADLIEIRDKYNDLTSLHLQYKTKTMIDDYGVNPFVIKHVHATLKEADDLLKRTNAIYRKEYKRRENARPMPILCDGQLQYPVGKSIHGKFKMFWPTREELHFTQLVVDGNTIASPKFPLQVPQKYGDIQLTIRNSVTHEETVFRNTEK